MDKMDSNRELISALADGQLHGDAFARGVDAACSGDAAYEAWHSYHLIGEVLRTGECALAARGGDFLSQLQARLAQERVPARAPLAEAPIPVITVRAEAANDTSFRWKMAAGFASMAAVAAVGWAVIATPAGPQQPQLAAAYLAPASVAAAGASGTVIANTEKGAMIRDARLDEFLAAHRQFGGASALQMPAGFLRNATFEGTPADRR
jgi:sigma-E factor negative regulatory protein RseA